MTSLVLVILLLLGLNMTEEEEKADARSEAEAAVKLLSPDYPHPAFSDPYAPDWLRSSKDIFPRRPPPQRPSQDNDAVQRWISILGEQPPLAKI
jgi:hypothetical protein